MKSESIPLAPRTQKKRAIVHTIALTTFRCIHKARAQFAKIPDTFQTAASDIAQAWADSRPNV